MSDEPTAEPQRPTSNDRDAWSAYWKAQGMLWRTEPEIDADRQRYLAERRAGTPDIIQKGAYPFEGIQLDRADLEWLLATHESGGRRGPVDWTDKGQREREGLDLRGADLTNLDGSGLPLARLRCGSYSLLGIGTQVRQELPPTARLERATLRATHLEGADLTGVNLTRTHLEGANLTAARLEQADLRGAYFDADTGLDAVVLGSQRSDLYVRMSGKQGFQLWWGVAGDGLVSVVALALIVGVVGGAAWFLFQQLRTVSQRDLSQFWTTLTQPSELVQVAVIVLLFAVSAIVALAALLAQQLLLESRDPVASSTGSEKGNVMRKTGGAGRTTWLATFVTTLAGLTPGTIRHTGSRASGALLADVHWGDANLALVDWERIRLVGDELHAWQRRDASDQKKDRDRRLADYEGAARAYGQLAVALRNRGLNADADTFAYRARIMQRHVLRRQFHPLRALGSWLLDAIAGYGYRPMRSVLAYALVVGGFAGAYYLLGNNASPALDVHGAIVFSLTSFHGRGFSPGGSLSPDNPLTTLAAVEAVLGLLIEITFIATFTQRFFAR